jgi:hypothetical protein
MLKVIIILIFVIIGVHAANLSSPLQEKSDFIVWLEEKLKMFEEKDKEFEQKNKEFEKRLNLFEAKGILKRFLIVY